MKERPSPALPGQEPSPLAPLPGGEGKASPPAPLSTGVARGKEPSPRRPKTGLASLPGGEGKEPSAADPLFSPSHLRLRRGEGARGWGEVFPIRAVAFTYLAVMLIIPLLVIVQDGLRAGLGELLRQVTLPAAWHALKLTLWTAAVMTVINTSMGALTAYVLVRFEFPGKSVLNSIIDLPLSIPTLVTGVMLVVLFGPQQALGAWLKDELGISIIFAPPGIILALLFITFPFVVRAVQPVLLGLDRTQEDAAATLGANAWTIFRRITLPPLVLPLASGALLSFARAIGEFGSIVIVAGNIPLYSQTAAVYVLGEVESENRLGASAISVVMVAIAFSLMMLIDWLQARMQRRPA